MACDVFQSPAWLRSASVDRGKYVKRIHEYQVAAIMAIDDAKPQNSPKPARGLNAHVGRVDAYFWLGAAADGP